MHSQLCSISGGRSSVRNLRTRRAVVTETHITEKKRKLFVMNLVVMISTFKLKQRHVYSWRTSVPVVFLKNKKVRLSSGCNFGPSGEISLVPQRRGIRCRIPAYTRTRHLIQTSNNTSFHKYWNNYNRLENFTLITYRQLCLSHHV